VLGKTDLLHEKLRAGSDPVRRRSTLLEQDPTLASELTGEERTLLDRLPP
jgi:hypothetical protein